jgi:hypothetical protein
MFVPHFAATVRADVGSGALVETTTMEAIARAATADRVNARMSMISTS